MRRGPRHQCGDRSQKIVREQLEHGTGVGVVISPRDLSLQRAIEYAQDYHDRGAQVLVDQQFYEPAFLNQNLDSYATSEYRRSVSDFRKITDEQLIGLSRVLEETNRNLTTDGVIAPALIYETGRPDIVDINARLFAAAKQAGDNIGVPTYATVVLGGSTITTMDTTTDAVSHATALNADGWYYAFEFEPGRIPSRRDVVYRCCVAGLMLACTGKPVLHAYAGPMSLLSFGFGATGAAIGHSQNLWRFTRGRWQPPVQAGGGDAPPRYFSAALWGTIIYPDEVAQLSANLRDRVLTQTAFSQPVGGGRDWSKWDANKHLISIMGSTIADIARSADARTNATDALQRLRSAVQLHGAIFESNVFLRDDTNVYQSNWALAIEDVLTTNGDDFDYLTLLS